MKHNKLIIFDIDGTLTDSVAAHQKAFTAALYDLGVKTIDRNFKAYKHHTDSYIASVIYENDSHEKFKIAKVELFEQYLTAHLLQVKINEILGAKKLIEQLVSEEEFGICYATGSLLKPAIYKLDSIGIQYDVQQLVASNKIMERENIVLQAIENAKKLYNINKFERIISIGDGLWDLKTANNLGIEFIGIGNTNKDILLKNGMTNHFENLTNFSVT
jgi:beta-phosphoglucomutase-like phosphatase (HAD superfamily)